MSRSGYSSDCQGAELNLYRAAVDSAMRGKRGQEFLRDLAIAMDDMDDQVLIHGELIDEAGACCTIGVVCKARGLDVDEVDVEEPAAVGRLVGIARSMAAELEFMNDEAGKVNETPAERWTRMREWVRGQIL